MLRFVQRSYSQRAPGLAKRSMASETLRGEGTTLCSSLLRSALALRRTLYRQRVDFEVGKTYHDFELVEKRWFAERNLTALHLKHKRTGARHLHIDSADTNNVFMVTFKTSPTDSTGVAHVLEHTALCGSAKFPIRDPFFNMLKRSLQSYMNAWTGPDYTSYPFSTQNEKDFRNLMAVYLDAAYFPNLDRFDFMQEGHRLEFSNPTDPKSGLEYKGIVFNEMKGAMAESSRVFQQDLSAKLFPTVTYHHNSGGEPADIPKLTYEQLKEFHRTHYHPSNSYTATYGDLSLLDHLKIINEDVLSKFSQIDPGTDVPDERRYAEPQTFVVKGPPPAMGAEEGKQGKVAVSFLLAKNADNFLTSSFHLLSSLLTSGPNSPLYKALIESGLGNNWAPGSGYEDSLRETSFSVGLQGVGDDDVGKIEPIVLKTLEECARDGFPEERVEALLHQVELSQRHVTADFGLELVAGVSHSWIHGASPLAALAVKDVVAKLREEMAKGPFFQDLIKKYFLANKHRVTLVMTTDEEYAQKKIDAEKAELAAIEARLSAAETAEIVQNAAALKERQDQPQNAEILPKVTLADIERKKPKPVLRNETVEGVDVQWAPQPTNGLSYFKFLLNVDHVPARLLPYVPIFTTLLTNVGAGSFDYRALSHRIEATTGGLHASADLALNHSDLSRHEARVMMKSFALNSNLDSLFRLWGEIFASPTFNDPERIKTLLGNIESSFQNSLVDNGSHFARLTAAVNLSAADAIAEQWEGLTMYRLLKQIVSDENYDEVIANLQELASHILTKNRLRIAVNSEEKEFEKTRAKLASFLKTLPIRLLSSAKAFAFKPVSVPENTYIGVPVDIHHTARVFRGVPYTHRDYPTLQILSNVLRNAYLHREIREKGGAYGGGAQTTGSQFSFYSYRDPNVAPTLRHFADSIEWAAQGSFTDENIAEAKLNVFSKLDRPITPQNQGFTEFSHGITHEMKQLHRDLLFAVGKADLVDATNKYLKSAKSTAAVFGNVDSAKEFEGNPAWLVVKEDAAMAAAKGDEDDE